MSMAIKYAMQKKAKKMASGGMAHKDDCPGCEMCGGGKMADGGFVAEENASGYQPDPMEDAGSSHDKDLDMIEYIMKKRSMAKGYSQGGQVANDVGDGQAADMKENQFDDLVLRDDLESDYTGENSGDELGNEQKDEDERDVVSQIMKSRKKKDKNPSPA